MVGLRRRLEAEGANELVLDLRDNRGGLVQEGIEIAKLFLPGRPYAVCSRAHKGLHVTIPYIFIITSPCDRRLTSSSA